MGKQTSTPESFVARSQIHAIVCAEMRKFVDNVLVPAIGQAIGKMQKEVEARFEAKIAALEGRPGATDGDTSRDQISARTKTA